MRVHPTVAQTGGVVTVALQAQFVGDLTDTNDQLLIAAYGDPAVNLAGSFVDPSDPHFLFQCGAPVKVVGIVSEMHLHTIQFMSALPPPLPNRGGALLGPLQVITPDPVRAARIWREVVIQRITIAVQKMRELPVPINTLPDATI